jgi:hemerythrin
MKRGLIGSVERDGIRFETGPNAILLSDVPIQNGNLANLAEFPVLQMLYRQGMIIPGHPNNTGQKPLLLGTEEQLQLQSEYIFRGNYGLTSIEELMEAGVPDSLAREMMSIKRTFAFGRIRMTDELLDLRVIDDGELEIRPGVFVKRTSFNIYEFSAGGKSIEVDLSVEAAEEFEPPYSLGFHRVSREYFSIIHTGDGDGWNMSQPCMGSLVCFQERLYLIDAGPYIVNALVALGISVTDLEGVFQTHSHDDHFAGLTSLIRLDRRLKYFAAPYVRASVEKKLSALMGMRTGEFSQYFEVVDLVPESWNDERGLEVMPVYSPHPVETTVFFFRAPWNGGYRTYAHLADIIDFKVLRGFQKNDETADGISDSLRTSYTKRLLEPVDVKKIDAGGGMIHGNALDFKDDPSGSIFISHKSSALTQEEKQIGSSATFGSTEVLIPAIRDPHAFRAASRHLREYFPDSSEHELAQLANCDISSFNAGSIIVKQGSRVDNLYLVLDGVCELMDSEGKATFSLSGGALIGELAGLEGTPAPATVRAASFMTALRIPTAMYEHFVRKNSLHDIILLASENRRSIQRTRLFGDMVSFSVLNRIAQSMQRRTAIAGESVRVAGTSELAMLEQGSVSLSWGGVPMATLKPGGFWGEVTVLHQAPGLFEARADLPSTYFLIPGEAIENIPIVRWRLTEEFRKRLAWFRTAVRVAWNDEFAFGESGVDEQRRLFFRGVREYIALRGEAKDDHAHRIHDLIEAARRLFQQEELFLQSSAYPGLEQHRTDHVRMLAQLSSVAASPEGLRESRHETIGDFLKEWLFSHTMIEDRKVKPFIAERGGRGNAKSM